MVAAAWRQLIVLQCFEFSKAPQNQLKLLGPDFVNEMSCRAASLRNQSLCVCVCVCVCVCYSVENQSAAGEFFSDFKRQNIRILT